MGYTPTRHIRGAGVNPRATRWVEHTTNTRLFVPHSHVMRLTSQPAVGPHTDRGPYRPWDLRPSWYTPQEGAGRDSSGGAEGQVEPIHHRCLPVGGIPVV